MISFVSGSQNIANIMVVAAKIALDRFGRKKGYLGQGGHGREYLWRGCFDQTFHDPESRIERAWFLP